jgi:hypothetical protein
MTRRRALLLGSVALVAAMSLAVWLVWLRERPGITRENAARITQWMTLAEAEAILGGPPHSQPIPSVYRWRNDAIWVDVYDDGSGHVWGVDVIPVRLEPEGVLDRLRRWLGL